VCLPLPDDFWIGLFDEGTIGLSISLRQSRPTLDNAARYMRRRHLYVVGQTSAGISTLLLNLIAQDLAAGQGLAVLDPHDDLAKTVLLHVPRNRNNVIMPRQRARHIGRLNRC
jgi:hypothetical protein